MSDLVNRVRFSTTLKPEVLEALREHSAATHVPISKLVDIALQEYLDKQK